MKELFHTARLAIIAVVIIVAADAFHAAAWTAPSVAPTGGNVDAPINVGSVGQFKAGGLVLNTSGAANGLIVQSGNVGIGTVSPISPLSVGPNSEFTVNDAGDIAVTGASDGRFGFFKRVGTAYHEKMAFEPNGDVSLFGATPTEGNVGIGTASPTQKLDVNGNIRATDVCTTTGNCLSATGSKYCRIEAAAPSFTTTMNSWKSITPVPYSWSKEDCKRLAFQESGNSVFWPGQQWSYSIGCLLPDGSSSSVDSGYLNTMPSPPSGSLATPSPNCGW